MKRTIKVGAIALLTAAILAASCACTKKVDSKVFISVLAKRGIVAEVIQKPTDENNNVEIASGIKRIASAKEQGIRVILYTHKDEDSAEKNYLSSQELFFYLADSEGVSGPCEETSGKDYKKTIALLSFKDDDGTDSGTYSILIWSGKSVITIVADGVSESVVQEVDQIVGDLGFAG